MANLTAIRRRLQQAERERAIRFMMSRRRGGAAPAYDPVADFLALNGGAPVFEHPGGYISEARSTLADTTLITAQTNPEGTISISSAGIAFPASASLQAVRIRLEDGVAIPVGTMLRVEGERVSGTGGVRPRFLSSQSVGAGYFSQPGEFSVDFTLTTEVPASPSTNRYLELVVQGGSGAVTIRNVTVHQVPTGARKAHAAAGQSNMAGGSSTPYDSALDRRHPRLETRPNFTSSGFWATDGVTKGLTAPIIQSAVVQGVSPALHYMREHVKLDTSGTIHRLMANAQGGTSLLQSGGAWNPSGASNVMLDQLDADILAFLAEDAGNELEGILWCQGESDVGVGGAAAYPPVFADLVAHIRALDARIANVPFIVFSLNPHVPDVNGYVAEMIAAQASMDQDSGHANAIPGVYFMPYDPAWGDQSVTPGDVHFNAPITRVRGIAARQSAEARGVYA